MEKYTRVGVAETEMYMPNAAHRGRVGGGHGTARFDEDVWRCLETMTQRSRDFQPRWQKLDSLMDDRDHEYAELLD